MEVADLSTYATNANSKSEAVGMVCLRGMQTNGGLTMIAPNAKQQSNPTNTSGRVASRPGRLAT